MGVYVKPVEVAAVIHIALPVVQDNGYGTEGLAFISNLTRGNIYIGHSSRSLFSSDYEGMMKCSYCGGEVVYKGCRACDGSGKVSSTREEIARTGNVFKDCPVCKGSGGDWRCIVCGG